VPPTKGGDAYGPGSGGQTGSFNPGRSVQQHVIPKGFNQQNGNDDKNQLPGSNLPEELQDERYKNLDPRMVEIIENEIMDR
jgi:SpoVK/Ycf46/Vps4 family AAA+-type ATPase